MTTSYICGHPACCTVQRAPQVGDLVVLGISDQDVEDGHEQPRVRVVGTNYAGPECPFFTVEVRDEHAWYWQEYSLTSSSPTLPADCFIRLHPFSFHLYALGVFWGWEGSE
jgi:hypothetical protein